MNEEFKAKILNELKSVIDPELGVNIVDLGLIYDLSYDSEQKILMVNLTLTTPGCPLHDFFVEEIEKAALNVEEIDDVDINFVFDPPWNISMITDEAKQQLGMSGL
jgi:metal-sulfur cluster biosynthetic enzyme